MIKTIEHLFENSGLPGPRGNLELLHSFTQNASKNEVKECLSYYNDDLYNSPEEYVVMCGIVGLCIQNKNDIQGILKRIRGFASHKSWRIRESVAIGIQEIAEKKMNEIIINLKTWMNGNDLEKRAIVAALCEPKLLKEKSININILEILNKITIEYGNIKGKLTDNQNSL